MKSLTKTFGALAAGLVLASGCGKNYTPQIIGRGDYNGDSVEDFAIGDSATGEIKYINLGTANNVYTVLSRRNTNEDSKHCSLPYRVIFNEAQTEKIYFFDGKKLVEAPKWAGTIQELIKANRANTNKTQLLDSYETSQIEARQPGAKQ